MNELFIFAADILFTLGVILILASVGLHICAGELWILNSIA